jgi:hypothetical protein
VKPLLPHMHTRLVSQSENAADAGAADPIVVPSAMAPTAKMSFAFNAKSFPRGEPLPRFTS